MIKDFFKYTGLFLLLVLLQEFVFNNIQLSGFLNPYIYVLFILVLPFKTPQWVLLVSGFLLGFSVDIFTDTLGFNAFSTTLMAYCRPYVLNIISGREEFDKGKIPSMAGYGIGWFIKYAATLIVIHHFTLFYLEAFSFHGFFFTFFRVVLSSAFTLLFIIIAQLLFYKR
jgi:rod shape-determining protein MreD